MTVDLRFIHLTPAAAHKAIHQFATPAARAALVSDPYLDPNSLPDLVASLLPNGRLRQTVMHLCLDLSADEWNWAAPQS